MVARDQTGTVTYIGAAIWAYRSPSIQPDAAGLAIQRAGILCAPASVVELVIAAGHAAQPRIGHSGAVAVIWVKMARARAIRGCGSAPSRRRRRGAVRSARSSVDVWLLGRQLWGRR